MFFILSAPTHAQDWLPKGTKVVYSSIVKDGFLPDEDTRYKVKATKKDFQLLVKRLGFLIHTSKRKYTDDKIWLNWRSKVQDPFDENKAIKKESDWNPSDDITATYVQQEGNSWTLLKYEDGFIYYLYINH